MYYIVIQDCPYPYPEQKGVVRAKIYIGGYILKKIDENSTDVTYFADSDLAGSIPAMVKNQLSKKQG